MLTEILMEALMSMDEDMLDSVLESCSEEELEIIDSAIEITAMTPEENKHLKYVQNLPKTIDKTDPRANDPSYMKDILNNADYAKLNRLQHYITTCKANKYAGKLSKSSERRMNSAINEYDKIAKRLKNNSKLFNLIDIGMKDEPGMNGMTRDQVTAAYSLFFNKRNSTADMKSLTDFCEQMKAGKFAGTRYSKSKEVRDLGQTREYKFGVDNGDYHDEIYTTDEFGPYWHN